MTPNRSYLFQARYFLLVIIVLSSLVLLATVIWLSHPATVSANSNDMASAESTYPNIVGTRIDSCSLCHTSAPALNPYGAAYLAHGRNAAAFAAIANLDSDGDGWTNIQEIMALTFPGDPNDHPAGTPPPAPSPTSTSLPTSTSTPTVVQTSTSTSIPTSTTVGTPAATKPGRLTKTPDYEDTSTPHFEGTPRPTKTPDIDGTPRPTRTPGVHPTPTPCSPRERDDSFTQLDGGLLRTIAMTDRDEGCHIDRRHGNG